MAGSHAERLWLVGDDWIGRIDDGQLTVLEERQPLSGRAGALWSAVPDRRGGLYYGNATGLLYYHPDDGFERIGRDNGLLADGVTALFQDRENNLWVGTERGASKLISRRFARYDRSQGLYDDEVTAVFERHGLLPAARAE